MTDNDSLNYFWSYECCLTRMGNKTTPGIPKSIEHWFWKIETNLIFRLNTTLLGYFRWPDTICGKKPSALVDILKLRIMDTCRISTSQSLAALSKEGVPRGGYLEPKLLRRPPHIRWWGRYYGANVQLAEKGTNVYLAQGVTFNHPEIRFCDSKTRGTLWLVIDSVILLLVRLPEWYLGYNGQRSLMNFDYCLWWLSRI